MSRASNAKRRLLARERRKTVVREVVLSIAEILDLAGFRADASGRYDLPPNRATARLLRGVMAEVLPPWKPGDPKLSLTLTGAGPVWVYLHLMDAARGRCARFTYSAPNYEGGPVWDHIDPKTEKEGREWTTQLPSMKENGR